MRRTAPWNCFWASTLLNRGKAANCSSRRRLCRCWHGKMVRSLSRASNGMKEYRRYEIVLPRRFNNGRRVPAALLRQTFRGRGWQIEDLRWQIAEWDGKDERDGKDRRDASRITHHAPHSILESRAKVRDIGP